LHRGLEFTGRSHWDVCVLGRREPRDDP
jgi:hypothetical protein